MTILGIDASNIRAGGGVTHISELLNHSFPEKYNFKKIVIWGPKNTLIAIHNKPWIVKINHPYLNKSLAFITLWKLIHRHRVIKKLKVDILLVPSGSYLGRFRPYVAICQNMLVFEQKEQQRFGISKQRLKYKILNFVQKYSFNNANGIIFLSNYAKNFVIKYLKQTPLNKIIHHGVSKKFTPNKKKIPSAKNFQLLYISTISMYKHQWNVVKAVDLLIKKGYSLDLHLVGSQYPKALKKLNNALDDVKENARFIHYHGKIPYEKIQNFYQQADAFIFASTCENMPNILLEAMQSEIPIACSNYGPMKEIINDAFFFDPLSVNEIFIALEDLMTNPKKCQKLTSQALMQVKMYSWEKSANQTFEFLQQIEP